MTTKFCPTPAPEAAPCYVAWARWTSRGAWRAVALGPDWAGAQRALLAHLAEAGRVPLASQVLRRGVRPDSTGA
jgi:hypothetical protein